ncbi:MAG: hypothetical protein PSX80_04820 [bacterium]|nr:hypothetical protein [bacterium]
MLKSVDSSSIKGIYGPRPEDVGCCGAVSGRVSVDLPYVRALVWIEEAVTGRLIAATVPEKGGSYRLEGVPEGEFVLFASAEGGSDEFAVENTNITVDVADATKKHFVLRTSKSGIRVQLLGTSVQLARLPVDLRSMSQGLFIGVVGTPHSIARVGISGGGAAFDPSLSDPRTFSSVKVVGFALPFQPDLPKGEYTLQIISNAGVKQYLVGSLIIR